MPTTTHTPATQAILAAYQQLKAARIDGNFRAIDLWSVHLNRLLDNYPHEETAAT